MRHAVQRHRQRHPRLEQVGQLLRERRQFLQLRLALLLHLLAQRRRQERQQIHLLAVAFFSGRARLGHIHGHREQPEPLDLRQGRRAVRHLQDALDQFTAAAACFIGKFRHNFIYLKPPPDESFKCAART